MRIPPLFAGQTFTATALRTPSLLSSVAYPKPKTMLLFDPALQQPVVVGGEQQPLLEGGVEEGIKQRYVQYRAYCVQESCLWSLGTCFSALVADFLCFPSLFHPLLELQNLC